MPDDDDDHGDNRPDDMKIDDTILKLAEQYVSYENRARQLNKDKAEVRAQADKIGIPSLAWQIGVRTVKIMDAKERADFQRGFKRVTGVLSKNAETLFPEDIARRQKRDAKAAAKAAKAKESATAQEQRVAADSPRSDPKRGGAGGAKGRGKAKDAKAKKPANAVSGRDPVETLNRAPLATLTDAEAFADQQAGQGAAFDGDPAAANAALEQAEGDQFLTGHIEAAKSAAEPLSQSAQSAEALRKAGLA